MRVVLTLLAAAALSACATTETIGTSGAASHLKNGYYLMTVDATLDLIPPADFQDQAQKSAQDYCAAKVAGSSATLTSDGGAAGWAPQPNQVVFKCITVLAPG